MMSSRSPSAVRLPVKSAVGSPLGGHDHPAVGLMAVDQHLGGAAQGLGGAAVWNRPVGDRRQFVDGDRADIVAEQEDVEGVAGVLAAEVLGEGERDPARRGDPVLAVEGHAVRDVDEQDPGGAGGALADADVEILVGQLAAPGPPAGEQAFAQLQVLGAVAGGPRPGLAGVLAAAVVLAGPVASAGARPERCRGPGGGPPQRSSFLPPAASWRSPACRP